MFSGDERAARGTVTRDVTSNASPAPLDLVDCPECARQVSHEAELCPGCGYRLRGRHLMVTCPHCSELVVPEVHPRDTISLYCPLCRKPATNLEGRKTFFRVFAAFAGLHGAAMAGGMGCFALFAGAFLLLIAGVVVAGIAGIVFLYSAG